MCDCLSLPSEPNTMLTDGERGAWCWMVDKRECNHRLMGHVQPACTTRTVRGRGVGWLPGGRQQSKYSHH